jgi:uncharacterized lipoprotein
MSKWPKGGAGGGMATHILIGLLFTMVLAACSSKNISPGIYEGVRTRSQLQSTPSERLGRPELPADYQSYDSMRNKKE